MSETYSVVLTGKLLNGESLNDVKTSVGSAFKLSVAQLDKLFSGKPVALKRGLDKKQAVKLSTRLQQLGAHAVIKSSVAKPAATKAAPVKETEPVKQDLPFTDIVADMSESQKSAAAEAAVEIKPVATKAAKAKPEPAPEPPAAVKEPVAVSVPEVKPAAAPAKSADDITCPRCGHEQAFSTACGHCKMDLTMHIKRLERKAKVLANRA